jgi:hypothetical protein
VTGYSPAEIARYTVEQNGGEYTTDIPELLSLFGRRQLTVKARQEIREALSGEGVGTEPDLLTVVRTDQVRLFLLERAAVAIAPLPARQPAAWRPHVRPRTWKGWLAYGLAALLLVVVVASGSEEPRVARQAVETVKQGSEDTGRRAERARRAEQRALRRERERLRRQRAKLRSERREVRRERAQALREARRRERERQEQLEAQRAQPAPAPEPAASCHPSYDPCLDPNASDYDCEGGSGDGPNYTGFVTVKGPDDYGLDSDGDGTGCES